MSSYSICFFFFFGKKTTFLRYRTVCMGGFIVLLRILAILEGIFFFFYFLNIFIFNDITWGNVWQCKWPFLVIHIFIDFVYCAAHLCSYKQHINRQHIKCPKVALKWQIFTDVFNFWYILKQWHLHQSFFFLHVMFI